jgi:ATP-dependent DNA helicase RecQ
VASDEANHLGEAVLRRVVDAIEEADRQVPVAEIADTADVSMHVVDRVVNEITELGFVRLTGSGRRRVVEPERHLPPPVALAEQLVDLGKRRQAVLASRLNAIRAYAESPRCRRAEILAYFGETYPAPCNNCGNGDQPPRRVAGPRSSISRGVRVRHRVWGKGGC